MKFNKLKQLVIKDYTEVMEELYENGGMTSNEFKQDMKENVDEINECKIVDDLVNFYYTHGFDEQEAVEKIIGFLIEY
jgi:hypothetical protein